MPNPYDQAGKDIDELAAAAGVNAAKTTIATDAAASKAKTPIDVDALDAADEKKALVDRLNANSQASGGPPIVNGPNGPTVNDPPRPNPLVKYATNIAKAGYAPFYYPVKVASELGQGIGKEIGNSIKDDIVPPAKPLISQGLQKQADEGAMPVDPSSLQPPSPVAQPQGVQPGGGMGGGGAMPIPQEIWKLGPRAVEAYRRGFGQEILAAKAESDAMQPELEAQKKYWQDFAAKAQAREDGLKQAAIDDNQKKQQAFQAYQAAQQELSSAAKVDPNRWWANTSTPQKIMLTIAAMLSGYASGLHGNSDNMVLRMVNQRIAEDIDAQKTDYAMKRDKEEGAKNAYAMAMNMIGDSRAAEATTWAAALDAAKAKMGEFEASTKSALQKAQLQKAMAGIDMQIAQFLGQATAYGLPPGAAGGGAGALQKGDQADMKWLAEQLEKADYAPTMQTGSQVISAYKNGGEGVGAFANYLYNKSPYLYEKQYGQAAAQREMLWNGFRNQAIKSLSGSGVTGTEMVRMQLQLDSANDPASRVAAAKNVMNMVQARANQAIAVNPRAADVYFNRLAGAPGMNQQQAPAMPPTSPVKPAK